MDLPEGFTYHPRFLTADEETQLLVRLKAVEFAELRMRARVPRRRVAHFGWLYRYDSWKIEPGPPIPEFLNGVRNRAAALVHVDAAELVEAVVTEYPAGAAIGWHRDAAMFGTVVAISLRSPCRLRLRAGSSGRATASLTIEPRSAYVFRGAARNQWQHSIAPIKSARYSITFRTLRARSARRAAGSAAT